jgi:VanZ family protein
MAFIKKYKLAILWALISLTACGINGQSLPKISFNFGIDKIAHFVLFGIQAWLIIRANYVKGQKLPWKIVHTAVAISLVYGIFIEGLQATVFVNRSYDYVDMIADGVGALFCYPWVYFRNKLYSN